jgi:hypothetical protein
VTRHPFDGFLKIPLLSDANNLAEFTDWRQSGKISVDDLAIVVCALMPLDEDYSTTFLRKTFKVEQDDTLSKKELVQNVLPYLQAKVPDMVYESESTALTTSTATSGLKKLKGVKHLYALRATCKKGRIVADSLLVYELLLLLQRSTNDSMFEAGAMCSIVAKAIAALAPEGSTVACSFFAELFHLEDDQLSKVAVEMLPKVSPREPWRVFSEVASKFAAPQNRLSLRPPPINTRLALASGLVQWSKPGNKRVVQLMAKMAAESNHRIAVAGMEALASVAEKSDRVAIDTILANLKSGTKAVKRCAEETLPIVARGDPQTIVMFCQELQNPNSYLERARAIDALGTLALTGDATVVKALSVYLGNEKTKTTAEKERCHDQDEYGKFSECKSRAIFALGKIGQKGDKSIMKAIFDCLSQATDTNDASTAYMAVRSFAMLTEKSNTWAIQKLNSVFDDKKFNQSYNFRRELKRLILELFAEIGEGGDGLIFRLAMEKRHDGDQVVRAEAVRTSGKVFHISEDLRVHNLEKLAVNSTDAVVRREAEAAMMHIEEVRKQAPADGHQTQPSCGCTVM